MRVKLVSALDEVVARPGSVGEGESPPCYVFVGYRAGSTDDWLCATKYPVATATPTTACSGCDFAFDHVLGTGTAVGPLSGICSSRGTDGYDGLALSFGWAETGTVYQYDMYYYGEGSSGVWYNLDYFGTTEYSTVDADGAFAWRWTY